MRYWLGGACLVVGVGIASVVFQSLLGPVRHRITGSTMGTYYTVTYWASGGDSTLRLKSKIESRLDEIEEELSNWATNSWISRFNRRASREPFPLSEHAARVLRLYEELADATEGALDPTLGRLINLWGLGPKEVEGRPTKERILEAMEASGHERVRLYTEPSRIAKAVPDLRLNLSAVAKGYAADRIAGFLEEQGLVHYLVNIGGDLRAGRHPEDSGHWQVAIQVPSAEAAVDEVAASVPIAQAGLATSGDYRRFTEEEGTRRPHIVNPETGRPVNSALASVTVIAPTCAWADGLATACMVRGLSKGRKMLERMEGVEGMLIERVGTGQFRRHATSGWKRESERKAGSEKRCEGRKVGR